MKRFLRAYYKWRIQLLELSIGRVKGYNKIPLEQEKAYWEYKLNKITGEDT